MTPNVQQSILLLAQAKQWVITQNHANAVQAFQQSVRLNPQNTVAWQEFINFLINLNELPNALKVVNAIPTTVYQQSWQLQDRHAVVLSLLEKYEQALPVYLAVVDKANNNQGRLFSNIATCYFQLRDDENAFTWMKKAIAITNDNPNVDLNLAALYTKMNDIDSARITFEEAIKRFPQNVEVRYAYACFLLTDEQYEKGFQLYRNRWLSELYDNQQLNLNIPHWKGERVKSLLIIKEQGVGDEILFSLFLPALQDKAEKITVLADYRLQPLFERSFPAIRFLPYKVGETCIDNDLYDAHLYFADAGFFAHQSVGKVVDFLKADAQKIQQLREKYQRQFPGKKLVGLSWKSTRQGWHGEGRNTAIAQWERVLKNPDYQFFSLQYGEVKEELAHAKNVLGVDIHVDPDIDCKNDLDGLAAQMGALDLVISAANTNAHLAAATGVPTWITVPCGPGLFWCWGYREVTPFYPNAHLFRATKSDDWIPVIQTIAEALETAALKTD